MTFSLLIGCLYFIAALLAARSLQKRKTGIAVVGTAAALLLAMEEISPILVPETWPAHNVTEMFTLAARGISNPTTLGELTFVAGGRLIALLGAGYLAFFALQFGKSWKTGFDALPKIQKTALLVWFSAILLAALVQIFVLLPTAAIPLRLVGGGAALLLAAHLFTGENGQKTRGKF